ncbi:hypothetical protein EV426DRAFT_704373 [Tirmania nivea]|nr:hypothetical protein EV426DRAFT_704373 [Tirmania nivea]
MQSRLDSPNSAATSSPDQYLMERAREDAIKVRKEEQEIIVQSRKRKLRDLYQVTRQIEWNKTLPNSPQYVLGSGLFDVDELERRFLELNDILLGRLYDESSLPRLITATITPSAASKHSLSPILARKTLPGQQSPRASARASVVPQIPPGVAEVHADSQELSIKSVDTKSPEGRGGSLIPQSPIANIVEKAASTPSLDDSTTEHVTAVRVSPVSRKRRKVTKPSSPILSKQDDAKVLPAETSSLDHVSFPAAEPYPALISESVVDVPSISVSQDSRPLVNAGAKDAPPDSVSIVALSAARSAQPPPSPTCLVKDGHDMSYRANGHVATVEKNVQDSLTRLSGQETLNAISAPVRETTDVSFPVQKQKKSSTTAQPQLAVVPPIHCKFTPPVYPTRLHDRQNTPSSPITSEDEDDDNDNNAAIISSATSPDTSGLLPDDARSDTRQAEVLDKKDLLLRMSDPSAQLRLEDELARKDHGGPYNEFAHTKNGVTERLEDGRYVDIMLNGNQAEKRGGESVDQIETSEEISEDQKNQETSASVPIARTSKLEPDKEEAEKPVGSQVGELSQSIDAISTNGLLHCSLDVSVISNEQNDGTSAALLSSKAKTQESNIPTPNIALVPDVLTKPRARSPSVPENLENGNLVTGNREAAASALISGIKKDTDERGSPSVQPKALVSPQPAIVSDFAQRDTTGVEFKLPADVMDVEGLPQAPIANAEEEDSILEDGSNIVPAKKSTQLLTAPANAEVEISVSDKSKTKIVTDSKQEEAILQVDTGLGISTETDQSCLALLKVLEEKRRKEKERGRLAKVVFAEGQRAENSQCSNTRSTGLSSGSQIARFPQEVAKFLSYSTKKRAHKVSTEAQPIQVTRQRSGSITVPHGLQYSKKDYLTPYFQLEAFEQPLQNLLHQSHKTLLTANHQLVFKEQQTKKVYRRIQQLQEKGLWSLRQPARVREPERKLCHWDYLLQEANWLSVDFRQERRLKITQCKILVDMIMEWHSAKPEERRLLCVDKTDLSRRRDRRARRSQLDEIPDCDRETGYVAPNTNADEDQVMQDDHMIESLQNPTLTLRGGLDGVIRKLEPMSERDKKKFHIQEEECGNPEFEWDLSEEDTGIFGHLETPPVRLFTLGPEETIFQMPLTYSASEILSELPIQIPPTLPVDASILDSQVEESWQMPIIPVSKLCVAKLVLNDEGPPRKKSRYEYQENYNLFAEDSDSEDGYARQIKSSSFAEMPGKLSNKPVPIPPESTSVALFNPDFKHILNRMQGHNFKPPSYMPPPSFFENRLASQWLPSEDEKLKDLVQRYPQNWTLISTFMTFKGDIQSASDRRSPWECFERYLQIEPPTAEFLKSPYYKGIQQRLDISGKAGVSSAATGNPPNGNGGSGTSTPTIRRRGNAPLRVERRKNTKFVHLFESMRKLAKRRELSLTKQQSAAGMANRKAEQQSQTKPKLQNFVPAHFSKMKHEREMKIERQARENAALVAQQRHAQQQRNGTSGVSSPVVTSANPNGLPQGAPGIPVHRASPSVAHLLPNGVASASGGAPVPGMAGISHNTVAGVQTQVNGTAAANAMALGLRQHAGASGAIHGTAITPQQFQLMKLRYAQVQQQQQQHQHQQQVAQVAAVVQQAQNGSHSVAISGLPANYSQHAILLAAQQQALSAASANSMKQHHTNGTNGDNSGQSGISQGRSQLNVQGQGQAGSPRLQQPQQIALHAPLLTPQQISNWLRSKDPNLTPEQLHKLTEQRLAEYHNQMRAQLSNVQIQSGAAFPTGVTVGLTAQPQQLYQQQQVMRQQQHMMTQQQSRQGSQGPAQMQQSTIVGGVVSRGTTPQQTQHLLQRTASMQSVGHPLQRTQSIGQQNHVQVQQQSPRQSTVQQAQMAGIPQPQQHSAPQA